MARAIALIQLSSPALVLHELARKTIVLGCASALILAGRTLPF
ncbi:hypothetical protein NOLU111490_15100 [Novosphingobium lubricantis]|jgi:hypothetical protein